MSTFRAKRAGTMHDKNMQKFTQLVMDVWFTPPNLRTFRFNAKAVSLNGPPMGEIIHLLIAALWSPAGKKLTSWLLLVMYIIFLLLSHMVSYVRCDT